MISKTSICCGCLISLAFPLMAQTPKTWSLKECIDYALSHNITIHQQELSQEAQEISLHTSRMSRLPDLNASVGQGFGFGRSTGRDGSTVDQTSASTSFHISSSIPLFTGFRIPNQVKADKFSLKAATAQLEKARQDVSINVATAYLNALYYKGLEEIATQQVTLSREQLSVAQAMVLSGKKPQSEQAEAEALLASAQYDLTQAQGNTRMARLSLCQLLNLTTDFTTFEISEPDTSSVITGDMPLPDLVFEQAVSAHPAILAAGYELESSRHQMKVSRSYMMPSLSLNASYSNSYYYIYDHKNMGFADQMDLNGSEYIGISLSIPIFNRFATRNNLRQARLNIRSRELALTDARQTLHKEIQQAFYAALAARDNFASAQKAHTATRLSYQYESERYAVGRSTSLDLSSARQKLEKASQDALQAKCEYLLRMKILEFYNGVPLQ